MGCHWQRRSWYARTRTHARTPNTITHTYRARTHSHANKRARIRIQPHTRATAPINHKFTHHRPPDHSYTANVSIQICETLLMLPIGKDYAFHEVYTCAQTLLQHFNCFI